MVQCHSFSRYKIVRNKFSHMASIFLSKLFGNRNQRLLKQLQKTNAVINGFAKEFKLLSDQQLRAKTAEFRNRLKSGANLDDILPEAFATVREVSSRVLHLRHFDVQLV